MRLSIAVFAFILVALPAWGTHLPDHRVSFVGIVYDQSGRPAPHVTITLRDPALAQALADTTSTAIGTYQLVGHLHDEDVGRRLVIETPDGATPVIVEFDPTDHLHERQTRIDLNPPLTHWYDSQWFSTLVTGAFWIGVIIGTLFLIRSRRRATTTSSCDFNAQDNKQTSATSHTNC